MIETQTTEQAFLADMRENHDDHSIPLIFADYLSENGQEDRGELIQVQDYLRRFPHGHTAISSGPTKKGEVTFTWNHYSRRQQELIGKNAFEWCYPILCGRSFNVDGHKVYAPGYDQRREYEIHFHHGYVSLIKCRLAEWYHDSPHGKPNCIDGRDIVKHHPLLRTVEIVDKEPTVVLHTADPSTHRWYWIYRPDWNWGGSPDNILPFDLFRCMDDVTIIHDSFTIDGYESAAVAKQALSDACLKWAING